MYYYEPNDKRPVRWAVLLTLLYAVVVVCAFLFVTFDIDEALRAADEIVVEFVEPEPPVEQPEPPRPEVAEPRMHDVVAAEDNERKVSGTDKVTQTVNPRALFHQPKGGVDDPENAGNPKAREAETDAASGDGGGLNADGNDQLDKGLQGRGLVGSLPKPMLPKDNKSGKVIIRVTVDQSGRVTSAEYEPIGSTTSDNALVEAARAAAKKARFTESRAYVQGGTITYYFNLK